VLTHHRGRASLYREKTMVISAIVGKPALTPTTLTGRGPDGGTCRVAAPRRRARPGSQASRVNAVPNRKRRPTQLPPTPGATVFAWLDHSHRQGHHALGAAPPDAGELGRKIPGLSNARRGPLRVVPTLPSACTLTENSW